MRSVFLGTVVGALTCCLLLPTFGASPPSAANVEPAAIGPGVTAGPSDVRRIGHFLELEDGRRLARLDGLLRHGARYRLTISASGPDVEPLPGWRGVGGANTLTAEELDQLVHAAALTAHAMRADDESRTEARVRAVKRERLPIRTFGANGRIDFSARTDTAHVTVVEVDTGDLAYGSYTLEIAAKGEVRLRSAFRLDADGGAILTFETTGGLHRVGTERP